MTGVTDERERDDVGRLVIITGLPGSGKTTLSTELASVMPALRMCPDDWMARAVGASVELRYVTADTDELWRRIVERDLEGRWGSRSIRRAELDAWTEAYQVPDAEEMSTYDPPESV